MRCIREIIRQWKNDTGLPVDSQEFDVRVKNELPDTSFDIYISSGGPGDLISTRYEDWDISWNKWLKEIHPLERKPYHTKKKYVFICPLSNWPAAISMPVSSHQTPVYGLFGYFWFI